MAVRLANANASVIINDFIFFTRRGDNFTFAHQRTTSRAIGISSVAVRKAANFHRVTYLRRGMVLRVLRYFLFHCLPAYLAGQRSDPFPGTSRQSGYYSPVPLLLSGTLDDLAFAHQYAASLAIGISSVPVCQAADFHRVTHLRRGMVLRVLRYFLFHCLPAYLAGQSPDPFPGTSRQSGYYSPVPLMLACSRNDFISFYPTFNTFI